MTNILLVILVTLALAYFLSKYSRSWVAEGAWAGFTEFSGNTNNKNYLFDANAVSVVSFLTNIGIILLFFS